MPQSKNKINTCVNDYNKYTETVIEFHFTANTFIDIYFNILTQHLFESPCQHALGHILVSRSRIVSIEIVHGGLALNRIYAPGAQIPGRKASYT